MSTTKKNVVFDVVGICVSYDAFYDATDARLGDKLRAEGIKPKLLGFAWQEAAEREYTYLSMSGGYLPFWKVFQPLFHRMPWMAGIELHGLGVDEWNGVEIPLENFTSCDSLGVGKPAPGAYTPLLKKFEGCDKPWFAAAHTWDAGAARRNGFNAAWCSAW